MIIKQRDGPGKIASMNLVGNVTGKNAIIVDDMIDTAGTLCEAAKAIRAHGANSVYAFATHGTYIYQVYKVYLMVKLLRTYKIRSWKTS